MSCKILADGDQQLARPLQWRKIGAAAASATESQATPAHDSADVQKLQSRIAQLERALEAEVRQARERGMQEGQNAGRESATAELRPVMERLLRSCAEVSGLRSRIRKETESDLVTLTIAIARRVLRRELSVDPEAIQGVVNAALSKLQTKELTVIRSHPEHVQGIRTFFERSGIGAGVEVAADATLPIGGVVLETKRGNLDASVDTQLKEIERGFADRLGR